MAGIRPVRNRVPVSVCRVPVSVCRVPVSVCRARALNAWFGHVSGLKSGHAIGGHAARLRDSGNFPH
jgi:hypothetical protein